MLGCSLQQGPQGGNGNSRLHSTVAALTPKTLQRLLLQEPRETPCSETIEHVDGMARILPQRLHSLRCYNNVSQYLYCLPQRLHLPKCYDNVSQNQYCLPQCLHPRCYDNVSQYLCGLPQCLHLPKHNDGRSSYNNEEHLGMLSRYSQIHLSTSAMPITSTILRCREMISSSCASSIKLSTPPNRNYVLAVVRHGSERQRLWLLSPCG